jgi:hypothetical protein
VWFYHQCIMNCINALPYGSFALSLERSLVTLTWQNLIPTKACRLEPCFKFFMEWEASIKMSELCWAFVSMHGTKKMDVTSSYLQLDLLHQRMVLCPYHFNKKIQSYLCSTHQKISTCTIVTNFLRIPVVIALSYKVQYA